MNTSRPEGGRLLGVNGLVSERLDVFIGEIWNTESKCERMEVPSQTENMCVPAIVRRQKKSHNTPSKSK